MEPALQPIGYVRSPYKKRGDAPRQGRLSEDVSEITINPDYREGLYRLEGHEHLVVLTWFDRSDRTALRVTPPGTNVEHGVFATRSPDRPNPVGFSVVDLIGIKDDVLTVRGLDSLDGTPVIDIKPYLPEFDCPSPVPPTGEFVTVVAAITRRLKEGKTYDDFRKAWFHTTGFGVSGKEKGGSNRMVTLVNVFDPKEITVIGFATVTLEQLSDAVNIDVKYRGENPLDNVIEPEIERKFCSVISEDDFSAVGEIPYKPPSIGGRETDLVQFERAMQRIKEIYASAAKRRDAINEARRNKR